MRDPFNLEPLDLGKDNFKTGWLYYWDCKEYRTSASSFMSRRKKGREEGEERKLRRARKIKGKGKKKKYKKKRRNLSCTQRQTQE